LFNGSIAILRNVDEPAEEGMIVRLYEFEFET